MVCPLLQSASCRLSRLVAFYVGAAGGLESLRSCCELFGIPITFQSMMSLLPFPGSPPSSRVLDGRLEVTSKTAQRSQRSERSGGITPLPCGHLNSKQLLENLSQPGPNSPQWILSLKYYITESKMQLKISRRSSFFLCPGVVVKGRARGWGRRDINNHLVFSSVISVFNFKLSTSHQVTDL